MEGEGNSRHPQVSSHDRAFLTCRPVLVSWYRVTVSGLRFQGHQGLGLPWLTKGIHHPPLHPLAPCTTHPCTPLAYTTHPCTPLALMSQQDRARPGCCLRESCPAGWQDIGAGLHPAGRLPSCAESLGRPSYVGSALSRSKVVVFVTPAQHANLRKLGQPE